MSDLYPPRVVVAMTAFWCGVNFEAGDYWRIAACLLVFFVGWTGQLFFIARQRVGASAQGREE